MSPNSDPVALSVAASSLSERVGALADHLEVSQRQVARMRLLTALTTVLAVVAVIGGAVSIYLLQEVRDTTNENRTNAVRACQNTNDVRAANLRLWSFVLDASVANRPEMTTKERLQVERIRTWITKLYAPHDCSDLGQSYPIPPPPPILNRKR